MPAAAAASRSSSPSACSTVGIEPIGQQREPQVPLAVAQVVDLQRRHLRVDVGGARQQHRHGDERSHLGRHPIVEVEPRQRSRTRAIV